MYPAGGAAWDDDGRRSVGAMANSHWSLDGDRHLIAHRGASAFAAENSPAAIEEAARRGATDVEIDLNMTADGVLVAVHDGIVHTGTTNDDHARWISQVTADELDAASGGRVSRLTEILATVADTDLGLYLDVKQLLPGGAVTLREQLERVGLVDRTVGASFRSDLALTLKREAGLTTSVLFHDPGIDLHSLVAGTDADFVHPCFDVFPDPFRFFDEAWVEAALGVGCGLIAWNTLDVSVARRIYELGAHGVCSDDPEVLTRAVVGFRREPH